VNTLAAATHDCVLISADVGVLLCCAGATAARSAAHSR
jgi:hypothetical protein